MTPLGWAVIVGVIAAAVAAVVRAHQWRDAALEWAAVVVLTGQSAGAVMDKVVSLGKSATSFTQTEQDRIQWRAKEVKVNEMVTVAVHAAEQLHEVLAHAEAVAERRRLERVS